MRDIERSSAARRISRLYKDQRLGDDSERNSLLKHDWAQPSSGGAGEPGRCSPKAWTSTQPQLKSSNDKNGNSRLFLTRFGLAKAGWLKSGLQDTEPWVLLLRKLKLLISHLSAFNPAACFQS
jgi:hypothetical protein